MISGATVASANGKIRLATGSGALILEDASGASRRDDVYDASPTRGVIRTDNADIELAVNDLIIHDNDPDETAQIRAGGGKDIVFLPTVGRSVGLGGAAGGFQLDDSEIAALETSGRIRFGAPNKRVGEVRIDTADFSAVGGLELFSNASIGDTGAANPSAPNQLQAGTLRLDAGTGVGDGSNPLNTAVTSIDAQTTGGGIFIDEIDAVQLGNTAPVTTGSGGGAIEITAGGTMTLAQAVTTTGGGLISLTTTAGNLQVDHAVTAGGSVVLTGDTGITHTAAGDVTSGGTITATTTTGDIAMADGTVYSAGGDVILTAANDVKLGRVETGTDNTIRVTATGGAISDNTAGEGAGNENLVCCNIILTAANGIGGPGEAADIDVTAGNIETATGSGGVYLAETDTLQCRESTVPPPPVLPPPGPGTPGPDTTVPDPTGPDVTGPDVLVSEPPRSEGIPDKATEPEKIPNDTIVLQVLLYSRNQRFQARVDTRYFR